MWSPQPARQRHWRRHRRKPPPSRPNQRTADDLLFFNADEVAFVEAAVARLIPADDQWPGALEAGVPNFLDKELNGAWGAGDSIAAGHHRAGTPFASSLPSRRLARSVAAALQLQMEVGFAQGQRRRHGRDCQTSQRPGHGGGRCYYQQLREAPAQAAK